MKANVNRRRLYYRRVEEGKQYPVLCRRLASLHEEFISNKSPSAGFDYVSGQKIEQKLIDYNQEAERFGGCSYIFFLCYSFSPLVQNFLLWGLRIIFLKNEERIQDRLSLSIKTTFQSFFFQTIKSASFNGVYLKITIRLVHGE